MNQAHIRNFSIIAHIDHGKTTLTDRLLELTHTVDERLAKDRLLDSNPIERERGITIKLAPVSMIYDQRSATAGSAPLGYTIYQMNLIDTPGHVDFNYEVERSLAACEGAILLVDATQGVQAQTLANLKLAQKQNLTIIPIINKIDAPLAAVDETEKSLRVIFPDQDQFLKISAKTGLHVDQVLPAVIATIPAPAGDPNSALTALVFNSYFHPHLGVIAFVRVFDGELTPNTPLVFLQSHQRLTPRQIGVFKPGLTPADSLSAGQVGYIATGLKDLADIRVGDTLTQFSENYSAVAPLPGYRVIKPNVYMDIYPADASQYQSLLDAAAKLKLNDSALSSTPTNSPAMGNGLRVGFLGLLHADVIRERLEREFGLSTTFTSPSVEYLITTTDDHDLTVTRASDFPDPSTIRRIQEPLSQVTIISPPEYLGGVMQLLENSRGAYIDTRHLGNSVEINYFVPLVEVITGLHDSLKSVSSGYATLDYQPAGYQDVDLVKLTVLLNHESIPPLDTLVVRSLSLAKARRLADHLKDTIPRHQFEIPIQIAIGGQIIARETVKAFRKDVTAKLYGGDRTRRMKLLEKQKKGKARMKSFGTVNLPPEVFRAAF